MKKYHFRWKGISFNGEPITGDLFEQNKTIALVKLRRRNISSINIKRVFFVRKASDRNKINFHYQLSTLLKAGIPLLDSLKAMGHKNSILGNIANALYISISDGNSFSEAAKQHPHFIAAHECNLISIGEKTGSLDLTIEKIAQNQDRARELKYKVLKAINYPCLTILVNILVVILLLYYIVPEFERTFKSFNGELPWLAQIIIRASDTVTESIFKITATTLLTATTIYFFVKKSKNIRLYLEKLILKIPFTHYFFSQIISIQFARALEINLSAGVSLLSALENITYAQPHEITKNAIIKIQMSIKEGNTLSSAIEQTNIFPRLVTQMVSIGEEAGALEMIFSKLSSHYEQDIDSTIEQLIALLEPTLMLIVGAVTGTLILALYLPMFQLGSII